MIAERTQVARKHYYCHECSTTINPGDRYALQILDDYGNLATYKAHTDCFEARKFFDSLNKTFNYGDWYPLYESLDSLRDRRWIVAHYPQVAERIGVKI